MAIDTAAAISFFTDGFTNISNMDPDGQYVKLTLMMMCQDGKYVPCPVTYEAPAGEFILPSDIKAIAQGVYNNLSTPTSPVIARVYEDGVDYPDIESKRFTFYNDQPNTVYGIAAIATKGVSAR